MNTPKILIYNDPESLTSTQFLPESLHQVFKENVEVKSCTKHTLKKELTPEINTFIVPGIIGEVCHYYDHLGGENAQHIQDYTYNGGSYLGLCAGAFQVMTDIRFDCKDGTVKTRKSPFGFISGEAYGPVEINTQLISPKGTINGFTHVRPMELSSHFAQYNFTGYALYSGGPAFNTKGTNGIGLARYADHPKKPIGLISSYYGKGLVIGSGSVPHYSAANYPEISPKGLSENDYNRALALKGLLGRHEADRLKYWSLILGTAVTHRPTLA